MNFLKLCSLLAIVFCGCRCVPQQDQRYPNGYSRNSNNDQQQYSRQEFRGVFPVVEVPPAFSETRQDSPIKNGNGDGSVGRTCINGQCFNSDGTPVKKPGYSLNTQRRSDPATNYGNTHNCRNGQCRPCYGPDCTLSDQPDFTVGSGGSGSSSSSQIRIGRVGPSGQPLTGSNAAQSYQYGGGPYGYGGKKSKKSKYKGPPMAYFPCSGNQCSTCIADKCYPRSYASLRVYVQGHCPPAACDENCSGFVTHTDSCPMCACSGYATREPCMNQTECPSHGSCRNYLCTYAPVSPVDSIQCQYAYQCKPTENCQSGRCVQDHSGMTHVEGRICAYDYHCPTSYTCRESTCWTDPRAPQPAKEPATTLSPYSSYAQRPCAFHYQCPSTFTCQDTRCIGSGISHSNSPCSFDLQCRPAEYCVERTCIPAKNVGKVQFTGHTYRCQYLPCNQQGNY